MLYRFNAYGHPNIQATHKTTLEFTKDKDITLNGDCIIGVNADFDLEKLKQFMKKLKNKKIRITIHAISKDKKISESIFAGLNPDFDDDKELIIRKTDFISERTFAINADKSAFELNRKLIDFLKEKNNKIQISISEN